MNGELYCLLRIVFLFQMKRIVVIVADTLNILNVTDIVQLAVTMVNFMYFTNFTTRKKNPWRVYYLYLNLECYTSQLVDYLNSVK